MLKRLRLIGLGHVVVICIALTSCATNPVTGERQVSLVSEQQEMEIGQQADKQVKQEYGLYNDAALQAYVNEVGQKLAKLSHRSNLEWHFAVVDSPDINAFALPGGYVYVTRGLMAYLDSEAELAGVLGHEIGHVTARHGAQRQTQGTIAQGAAILAEILGQATLGVGGAGDVVGAVGHSVILKYGRQDELQADSLGAEYLYRSGYDPKTMIEVIDVLKKQETFAADRARAENRPPQRMPDWLSTHPSNDQRLKDIVDIANKYQVQQLADSGRQRYLQKIDGMVFGDSPEQGVVRGSRFFHEPLGFALSAPQGWKYQNAPDAVLAANAERDAGVALRLVSGAGNSHEEIIRTIFKPQSGRVERTTINGSPATHFSGTARTRQGQIVPIEATVLTFNNQQFLLQQLYKNAAALNRSREELRAVISSFHAITVDEKKLARPYRIRIVAQSPGRNFATLAKESALHSYAEQQLRLLNGYYPGGEAPAGRMIKVVAQ